MEILSIKIFYKYFYKWTSSIIGKQEINLYT